MAKRWSPEQCTAIGDLVKRHRGALGLSVDTMAERAPMSPVTWGRVEAGESVRVTTYAGVEIAFGWQIGTIARYLETGEEPATRREEPRPRAARDLQAAMDDVLASDLPDARKLALIQALRDVEALRAAKRRDSGANP